MRIDSLEFFDRLAGLMNSDAARYELLGDIDLKLAIVMHRSETESFRVQLEFSGIRCGTVVEIEPGAEEAAECWVEGNLEHWQSMFDNIAENGHATGEWTLNTLTIMGERIELRASDPMGWDKFHRFNQTLQDFVDGSASLLTKEASHAGS